MQGVGLFFGNTVETFGVTVAILDVETKEDKFHGDLPVDCEMILGFAEVIVPFFLPSPSRSFVVGQVQSP